MSTALPNSISSEFGCEHQTCETCCNHVYNKYATCWQVLVMFLHLLLAEGIDKTSNLNVNEDDNESTSGLVSYRVVSELCLKGFHAQPLCHFICPPCIPICVRILQIRLYLKNRGKPDLANNVHQLRHDFVELSRTRVPDNSISRGVGKERQVVKIFKWALL